VTAVKKQASAAVTPKKLRAKLYWYETQSIETYKLTALNQWWFGNFLLVGDKVKDLLHGVLISYCNLLNSFCIASNFCMIVERFWK